MALVTTDSSNYTNIANAIRSQNGETTKYKPSEMSSAILSLNKESEGIDTSDATATSDDIVSPKTAYGKDGKIIGELESSEINTSVESSNVGQDENNLYLRLLNTTQYGKRYLVDKGENITLKAPLSTLGDALASDVRKGKTFTSESGLRVQGTLRELAYGSISFSQSDIPDSHVFETNLDSVEYFVLAKRSGSNIPSPGLAGYAIAPNGVNGGYYSWNGSAGIATGKATVNGGNVTLENIAEGSSCLYGSYIWIALSKSGS